MNFTPCGQSGNYEGYCLIKSVEKKLTSKGAAYLDMTLSDSSGEINAKFWDYKEPGVKYEAFDFIKVRGAYNTYNGIDQFRIDRMRHVVESDGVNIEDYVESAGESGEVMLSYIEKIVAAFEDEELKKLVLGVIDAYRDRIVYWPAALKLHHAVRGGLLLHTLSIIRLAQGVVRVYPFINKDLLYAGAILHDIAKIDELEVSKTGIASEYTAKGNLLGHLVMGAMNVDRIGRQLGVSEETLTLVEHMLISHHGKPEFGAAQLPMFIEAELLSELDLLDARMYEMTSALENTQQGEFTSRHWALDNRRLYNHGRSGEIRVEIGENE
ncbi:MAG: HD domain-containing protein [Clostridia bacterium]|nr:HD domain-containing protein [Clostridia bacterium]